MPGKPARAAAVSASASRVWITTGRPAADAISSWRSKSARWAGTRREVVEVVEARLADRHGARVLEELDELVDPCPLGAAGLMGIDPERREHSLLGVRDRECRVAGRDAGADRDDSRDADGPRPFDEERGGLVAAVEVGVGVDHLRAGATPRAARGEGRAAERPRSRASRP